MNEESVSATAAASLDPWERQEGETSKAFAAFCRFRDMRTARTLVSAYRLHTGKNQAVAPSGQWTGWYDAHNWLSRAQAYDVHLEREQRKQAEIAFDDELRSYRDRVKQLAAATLGNAVNMLTKLNARIKTLEVEEIAPAMIPGFARAAAYTATCAVESMAQGLAIEQLLSQLTDQSTTADAQ